MTNTKVDGIDAYATSDLVTPHPTKKGLYKIVGRTDDQIMHSTGEKVIVRSLLVVIISLRDAAVCRQTQGP